MSGTPRRSWPLLVGGLALVLLASHAAPVARAQVESAPPPPVLGCSWAPANAAVELVPEAEDEPEDGETTEREPRIVSSVPAPPNTRPNDQRRLAALATITGDEAVKIALGVLPDADRRRVAEVELEIEQGYVIWEVETVLRERERSVDRHAEVVVDAGNGHVLLVECAAEDD